MNSYTNKLSDSKHSVVANATYHQQQKNKPAYQLVSNRPEANTQRKLQRIANSSPQTNYTHQIFSGVIQRELFHYESAPFSAAEAKTWNQLVQIANGLNVAQTLISNVEEQVWDINSGVTVAGSLAGVRAQIRAGILTRIINRDDADALGWGGFAPKLANMATMYGVRTGPVSTGGHASQTYTYTTAENAISIAEETNAHGQTAGNLNTRRGQMKNAIDLYNNAVNAHANQYN